MFGRFIVHTDVSFCGFSALRHPDKLMFNVRLLSLLLKLDITTRMHQPPLQNDWAVWDANWYNEIHDHALLYHVAFEPAMCCTIWPQSTECYKQTDRHSSMCPYMVTDESTAWSKLFPVSGLVKRHFHLTLMTSQWPTV